MSARGGPRAPVVVHWKFTRLQGAGYLITYWTKPENALNFTSVTTDEDVIREKIEFETGRRRFELVLEK